MISVGCRLRWDAPPRCVTSWLVTTASIHDLMDDSQCLKNPPWSIGWSTHHFCNTLGCYLWGPMKSWENVTFSGDEPFLKNCQIHLTFLKSRFHWKTQKKPWFELLKFKNNYSSSWFPLLPYYMFFKQNRKNKSIYHYSDRVLLLYVFGGICFCKFSILKTPMTSARNYDSSHDIPTISPWYSHGFKVIPPILRISWNPHQWETSINFIPIKYNYITMFLSSIPYP